ncbi:hypothetical protein [Streptomyces sp. NPDC048637]|uniref:hypothetical protein n=1 Tax=Streptomyces sp. NPDC048637 TaxID=3155636 RepID=UPI0034440F2F
METWREDRKSADDAVAAIREAFSVLGLSDAIGRGIRPVVTRSGKAYVDLGMLRADQVEQAAKAICAASRHG